MMDIDAAERLIKHLWVCYEDAEKRIRLYQECSDLDGSLRRTEATVNGMILEDAHFWEKGYEWMPPATWLEHIERMISPKIYPDGVPTSEAEAIAIDRSNR